MTTDSTNQGAASGAEGTPETKIITTSGAHSRGEVSATTVGLMLGLATSGELRLLEGKVDLLTTKLSNLTVRMEKVLGILATAPTGSDLERIDVQIGALKAMVREFLAKSGVALADLDAAASSAPKSDPAAK